jgi:DNA repair protein RadC
MNMRSYLSDEQLLRQLLKVRKKDLKGSTVKEMVDGLTSGPNQDERFWLVREICQRYGEIRFRQGETYINSAQVFSNFGVRLGTAFQELFFSLILDNKHRVVSEQLISMGTLNQSLVHPREVFVSAIELRATAILVVHNHPAGDPKPSIQDIDITKRLVEVGKIIGINVIDHVIIGQGTYFSFMDEGIMP